MSALRFWSQHPKRIIGVKRHSLRRYIFYFFVASVVISFIAAGKVLAAEHIGMKERAFQLYNGALRNINAFSGNTPQPDSRYSQDSRKQNKPERVIGYSIIRSRNAFAFCLGLIIGCIVLLFLLRDDRR